MAPEGKTHLVAEHFCFRGEAIWGATDAVLTEQTVQQLAALGLVRPREVIGSCVVRVPQAYPLLDRSYRAHHGTILEYLRTFTNLQVIGRGGTFQYLNMDHAIASGMQAAEAILDGQGSGDGHTTVDRGSATSHSERFAGASS